MYLFAAGAIHKAYKRYTVLYIKIKPQCYRYAMKIFDREKAVFVFIKMIVEAPKYCLIRWSPFMR